MVIFHSYVSLPEVKLSNSSAPVMRQFPTERPVPWRRQTTFINGFIHHAWMVCRIGASSKIEGLEFLQTGPQALLTIPWEQRGFLTTGRSDDWKYSPITSPYDIPHVRWLNPFYCWYPYPSSTAHRRSASRMSAAPLFEEAARLPCFTIRTSTTGICQFRASLSYQMATSKHILKTSEER